MNEKWLITADKNDGWFSVWESFSFQINLPQVDSLLAPKPPHFLSATISSY